MKPFPAALILLLAVWTADGRCDLTGRWTCDDGGVYYLRQNGEQLHWYGEDAAASPAWTNIFSGRIGGDRVTGEWADVPKGRSRGVGTLVLSIDTGGDVLRVVAKTGAFEGTRWTRQNTVPSTTRPLTRLSPADGEDCLPFHPETIRVQQMNGRWQLIEGDYWLFDFGRDAAAAQQALSVIRHYRMDRACFVGQPESTFTYMLARGGVPLGSMAGEACVAFDPLKITVSRIQGRWRIVSGRRGLFDFGQNQSDARQALAIIQQHGFNRSCSVGPPEAGFSYLRR